MRFKRKIGRGCVFILVLALCNSILSMPVQALDDSSNSNVISTKTAVTWCLDEKVASGYTDGSFHEQDVISETAFGKMVSRVPGLYDSGADSIKFDVKVSSDELTRYRAAEILTQVLQSFQIQADGYDCMVSSKTIRDYSSIPVKYQSPVLNMHAIGLMSGRSDGKFHGRDVLTRGQAAVILYRLGQFVSDTALVAMPKLTNGKDITEENVFELLVELKAKFPSNKLFEGYGKQESKYKQSDNSIKHIIESYIVTGTKDDLCSTDTGCGGWAAFVCDYIFGQDAQFHETNLEHIRPGDLMLKLDSAGKLAHVQIYVGEVRGFDVNQSARITNANNGLGVPTAAGTTEYRVNWTNSVTQNSHYAVWSAY